MGQGAVTFSGSLQSGTTLTGKLFGVIQSPEMIENPYSHNAEGTGLEPATVLPATVFKTAC